MNNQIRLVAPVFVLLASIGCLCWPCPCADLGSPGRTPQPTGIAAPPSGQVLRLVGDDPDTLDPALAGDVDSSTYILQIFSGLVSLDADLNVVPDIAERWTVSEDGTVYTFDLRHGVVFHDGKPVTAQDVKYSIERACDPATGSRTASLYLGDIVGVMAKLQGQASEVRGVEAVDDYTVRITIDAAKSYFLSKLTYHTSFVVDRTNVESGDNWMTRPNGTGPFMLKERTAEHIVLAGNPHYYQGTIALQEVDYNLLPGSPMTLYEQGDLDVVNVGIDNIERVLDPASPLNSELMVVPSLDVWYVGFDTQTKPFDDVKVRQALAMATNRRGIVDVMFKKMRREARGILPPGMPGYNEKLAGLPFDPDQARTALAESSYGGPDDLPPIVFTVSGSGGTSPLTEALVDMYKEYLGVEVQVQQVESGFFDGLHDHRYQMFMLGWIADYPDPENFLDILFYTGTEGNNSRYSNPTVDDLLKQARTEPDAAKRMALYQQAEAIIVNDAPWVPLFHSIDYVLVKPYVKGLQITPQGQLILQNLQISPEAVGH
ncbi:MAG: peptide ABC transporter substrate-binding protein [Chloroflexi bacterium]|nr:peptide ABC transporter substrate-binding protein [Chloroflexota bacterium]MBU1746231.1 peptide ABC transporter substrate-binding protein [Chloroflexota bacterium]